MAKEHKILHLLLWSICFCLHPCQVLEIRKKYHMGFHSNREQRWYIVCVSEWRGVGGEWGGICRQEDCTDTFAWSRWEWILKGYSGSGWCPQESCSTDLAGLSHSQAHEESSAGPIHGNASTDIFFLHKPGRKRLQTRFHQSLAIFWA